MSHERRHRSSVYAAQTLRDGSAAHSDRALGPTETVLAEVLVSKLRAAAERGASIVVGTTAEEVQRQGQDELPQAEVFVSGLDWLDGTGVVDDETELSRLLLADQSAMLVSTRHSDDGDERGRERAVFGRGLDNGLVTVARRLITTGLTEADDPES